MHPADTTSTFQPAALAQALQTATSAGAAIDAGGWPASLTPADITAVHRERALRWGDADQAPHFPGLAASRAQRRDEGGKGRRHAEDVGVHDLAENL